MPRTKSPSAGRTSRSKKEAVGVGLPATNVDAKAATQVQNDLQNEAQNHEVTASALQTKESQKEQPRATEAQAPVRTQAIPPEAQPTSNTAPIAAAAKASTSDSGKSNGQMESKPEPRKFEMSKAEAKKGEPRNKLLPINIEEEIRRRAYEIYQQRGSGHGNEADDWLTAEREVRQRYHQQSA
jgi:Protein of unknown function (DUF2934)